jgi:predicted outer membrane repeat protein
MAVAAVVGAAALASPGAAQTTGGSTPTTPPTTGGSVHAQAGTCTATDATSWRAALQNASGGGCNDIEVQASFTMGSLQGRYNGAQALTINGNGFTINGNGTTRIVQLGGTGTVTINNLTFTNGTDVAGAGGGGGGNGGAIRADDEPLVVNGSTFTNNNPSKGGGGIAISGSNGSLTITGSTFSNNTAGNDGGAVRDNSSAALSITGSTFTSNVADGGGALELDGSDTHVQITGSVFAGNSTPVRSGADGGAINEDGDADAVNIASSTFTSNVADDDGGAIDCNTTTSTTADATTFNSNSTRPGTGDSGGAIDMEDINCTVTLVNSTVTQNMSGDDAALTGEDAGDSITLVYSSIVNNATNPAAPGAQAAHPDNSLHGAGNTTPVATANVEVRSGSLLSIFGSFIARPHGGPNCSDNTGAPLTGTTSSGFNLSDDTSCGLTTSTDRQGATDDPLVGPLANNGGPTQTVLPGIGSPLIDAIPPSSCQADGAAGVTNDQRGVTRPQGAGCDIGAVEVQALLVVAQFTG